MGKNFEEEKTDDKIIMTKKEQEVEEKRKARITRLNKLLEDIRTFKPAPEEYDRERRYFLQWNIGRPEDYHNKKVRMNIIAAIAAQYKIINDLEVLTSPDFDKIMKNCNLSRTNENIFFIDDILEGLRKIVDINNFNPDAIRKDRERRHFLEWSIGLPEDYLNKKVRMNIIASIATQYKIIDDLIALTNPDFDKILKDCGLARTDENIFFIGDILDGLRKITGYNW